MPPEPYRLTLPQTRVSSVVFSSPHSGRDYPAAFLRRSVLDERTIRTSEDAFIHDLLAPAPGMGAPLIAATAPRAYIDLNRSAEELDPALIEGVRAVLHNPRISSGLGVIPRVVSGGRAIYQGKIPMAEARNRLRDFWHPYHDRLSRLMDESHSVFGQAILIDVHSMPHEAIDSVAGAGVRRPEIVLGDRFGAAADPAIVAEIERAFQDEGLRVARNAPFAGAYIAQTYGRPSRRHHAVQVEIDRALYMNEVLIRPNGNYVSFAGLLERVLARIAAIGRPDLRLAAE